MRSLDIERLLDFGIRREKEVDEDDGWYEEGEECIYSLLDSACDCIHRSMWTIDNCIPMRCRIAANAGNFQYHNGSEMAKINTRRAPRSWRGTPVSPARHRSLQSAKVHATFIHPPSSLIVPPQRQNDAFRLGQPLLRYIQFILRENNSQISPLYAVSILLVNAVAVLSEDRFLARSRPSF